MSKIACLINIITIMADPLLEKQARQCLQSLLSLRDSIVQTKSCELTGEGRKSRRYGGHKIHQININDYGIMNKLTKIFEPSWEPAIRLDRIESQHRKKQMESFIKKNEQIAIELGKERKSMSDLSFNLKFQGKVNASENKISGKHKLNPSKQQRSLVRPLNRDSAILPSIGKVKSVVEGGQKAQNLKQKEHSLQTNTKVAASIEVQCTLLSQNAKNEARTNTKAIKSIDFRQPMPYSEKAQSLQPYQSRQNVRNKKKKLYKVTRKQRKNSLEDLLEAKIAPMQIKINTNKMIKPDVQSIKTSTHISERHRQISKILLKEPRDLESEKPRKKNFAAQSSQKRHLFNAADSEVSIYDHKIKNYRQFLFQINLAHQIFDSLVLADGCLKNEQKYKFYVGRGNNRQLVLSLMKRRFWWSEVDNIQEANFVWTQLKVHQIFELQQPYQRVATSFYEEQKIVIDRQQQSSNAKSSAYKPVFPKNVLLKVMTENQFVEYCKFLKKTEANSQKYQNYETRRRYFEKAALKTTQCRDLRVHNHFAFNHYIGNKKALFFNLKRYCKLVNKNVFEIVPLTFHIEQEGLRDPSYKQFTNYYNKLKMKKHNKNIWIVKPGENSNRGNGINVCDELYQINKIIGRPQNSEREKHTFIIQKYIENPLLYKGRKFDIRHYMLVTRLHGRMRLYFYGEGYVRTSSSMFDLGDVSDIEVHLTNDAIQKHAEDYGKYEQGNKISYSELQRYIDMTYPTRKYSLVGEFYPRIKQIALDTFKSCYRSLDPRGLNHNWEVFGLDFMLDASFNTWLIEVNTNPCLEISSGLLGRIIPNMLEHSLRLGLDPLFPPPCHYANSAKHLVPDNALDRLQFELLFDEARDGRELEQLFKDQDLCRGLEGVAEDEDTFDNEGKQVDFDIE